MPLGDSRFDPQPTPHMLRLIAETERTLEDDWRRKQAEREAEALRWWRRELEDVA